MPALVRALKRVDLPTLGRPTMPHLRLMTKFFLNQKRYCSKSGRLTIGLVWVLSGLDGGDSSEIRCRHGKCGRGRKAQSTNRAQKNTIILPQRTRNGELKCFQFVSTGKKTGPALDCIYTPYGLVKSYCSFCSTMSPLENSWYSSCLTS